VGGAGGGFALALDSVTKWEDREAMSRQSPNVLLASVAAVALAVTACGADVRITDGSDDGSSGDGGGGSVVTPPSGGDSSSTSAAGGSSTTGSGGAEPESEAEALVKAQCPDVGAEAHFCVTLGYPNTLYALAPDSGDVCYLGAIDDLEGADVSSIAVVGPNVHGCSYGEGVWRASVLGGPSELLPIACEALTAYQGGFLLADGESLDLLFHYGDFESIGAGAALEAFSVDPQFSRISTREGTLFTAWHSTDMVQVADLPSATELPDLLLEGFDDWVDGMSATADGRLYVLSSESIYAFDVATGELLLQTSIPSSGTPLTTLHCWTN
jgi:hypothetical protein